MRHTSGCQACVPSVPAKPGLSAYEFPPPQSRTAPARHTVCGQTARTPEKRRPCPPARPRGRGSDGCLATGTPEHRQSSPETQPHRTPTDRENTTNQTRNQTTDPTKPKSPNPNTDLPCLVSVLKTFNVRMNLTYHSFSHLLQMLPVLSAQ